MWGINYKKIIEDAVLSTASEYRKSNKLENVFHDPVIGYASARNPLFVTFFERNWTTHPKEIYRPGNTVIVHFLPFAPAIVESNRKSGGISSEWTAAYHAAIIFSALINNSIIESLEKLGRLTSLTNLPSDWNDQRNGPDWSHKLAAFVAGMGDFGIAASFNTNVGSSGRFGSVITEQIIEPSKIWFEMDREELEAIACEIEKSLLFSGPGIDLGENLPSRQKIEFCPAGAISSKGVDLDKCRTFCKTLKQIVPASDVCGKCFD